MPKRIMKYNPAFLTEEELLQSFIARQIDFDLILKVIRDNVVSSNQHVLVIGPRGSGKTTLILRIAAAVRHDPELTMRWHPLLFAEESYEVSSVGEFWLAALFYLSEQTSEGRWSRGYEEIKGEKDDTRLRERALGQLMDFCDLHGKGLLILVENFNMLFEQNQLSESEAWDLRHVLLNEPKIMMLATATSRFESIENGDKALFELFKIHELKPLTAEECRAVWKGITGYELPDDRIRPIQILTGGNPRLLTIISSFGANLSFRELMENLIHLVDDHTEYFKSHLDNLPPIERKVYLALSEIWDPATARMVAQAARLDVNTTSSLLNRLTGRGAVASVREGKRIKKYQVVERIYNIYHLMRRRGGPSNRVKAVVNFMVNFYGQEDLVTVTRRIVEEACHLDPELCQDHYVFYDAILQKVESQEIRDKIISSSPQSFLESPNAPLIGNLMKNRILPSLFEELHEEKEKKRGKVRISTERIKRKNDGKITQLLKRAKTLSKQLDKLNDAEQIYREAIELDPENSESWYELGNLLQKNKERFNEAEQAFRKAIEMRPDYDWAWIELGFILRNQTERFEESEICFRNAIETNRKNVWAWIGLGQLLYEKPGRYEEAEAAYRKAIKIDPNYAWPWLDLGQLLHEKMDRYEEAEAAYQKAIEIDPAYAWVWRQLGQLLHEKMGKYEEAKTAYQKAIEIKPDYGWAWAQLGQLLHEKMGKYEEAEAAYQKAIEIDPDYARVWRQLGQLLHEKMGKYEEAEAAYRKAIEIRPDSAWAWRQLGHLLHEKMGRHEEAEEAYRKAIENKPDSAWSWGHLGQLLHEKMGKYEEAEAAYRKAIEIKPDSAWAWAQLGWLLHEKMGRYEEAEEAYRKAIEIKPDYSWPWGHIGQLLHEKMGRYEEAEAAYQKAIEIKPDYGWAWAQLGQLLHEKMGKYEEAETAYQKAIEIRPDSAWAWGHLGQLLHEKMDRYEEAEAAYRKAIEIRPDSAWAWGHLGQLLHEKMDRYEEAEAAYRKAIETQPSVSLGWELLGKVLLRSEKYDEAYKTFIKALDLKPQSVSVRLDLVALLLGNLNQPAEALTLSTDLLKTQNKNPVLHNSFAWTFYKYGDRNFLDQAEVWARKAVSLDPDNPSYHHTLACILALENRAQEALEPAQQYLDKADSLDRSVAEIVELFVGLAAGGCVKDALKILVNFRFSNLLEPLLVALRLYSGEDVKAAVEIMEVAKDVLEMIKQRQQKLLA
jgi:tetratricopeptide (TPR) repeat protein/Cdc6-like AAA superfamily ATPase